MLSNFRQDPIPVAFKPRHTTQVTTRQYKPKPVFQGWKEDTMESLRIAMELDLKNIQLIEIVDEDKKEAPKLISKLGENYAPIKDIYHYLQGKSSQYPNIDFTTMRELFIKKLPVD